MFRHPKYYKELRKRNKLDQVISFRATTVGTSVHPGPGLQVTSHKLPGPRPISNANKGLIHRRQATSSQASSDKHQAPSNKRQASSRKRQAL
jgi:hypothetical protein